MNPESNPDHDLDAETDHEDAAAAGMIPLKDPEFGIWMKEHPEMMLAMLEVAHEEFEKRYPVASPERQAEMRAALVPFLDEVATCYVNVKYDGIVDRVNRIDPTFVLGEEDLEEVKSCNAELDVLVDVALDIQEPERTRYLNHMTTTRDYVRKILSVQ